MSGSPPPADDVEGSTSRRRSRASSWYAQAQGAEGEAVAAEEFAAPATVFFGATNDQDRRNLEACYDEFMWKHKGMKDLEIDKQLPAFMSFLKEKTVDSGYGDTYALLMCPVVPRVLWEKLVLEHALGTCYPPSEIPGVYSLLFEYTEVTLDKDKQLVQMVCDFKEYGGCYEISAGGQAVYAERRALGLMVEPKGECFDMSRTVAKQETMHRLLYVRAAESNESKHPAN